MGHSDIGVTLNTYTHLGLDDATDEFKAVAGIRDGTKGTGEDAGRKASIAEDV